MGITIGTEPAADELAAPGTWSPCITTDGVIIMMNKPYFL